MPRARRRAGPDRQAALTQYRRRAPFYDLELAPLEPVRRRAVAALALQPGQTVIDIGCGTGLSLAPLQAAVGAEGRIVGVELSPAMLQRAHDRVAAQGWDNVTLLEGTAAEVPLPTRADAALLHFTHDILQDEAALRRIVAALRPGGRIVAAGLKWAPAPLRLLNLLVAPAALHSVTSLDGLDAPWRRLAALAGTPQVESLLGGTVYLARWTLAREAQRR